VTARPGDEVPVGKRIAVILAPGESAEAVKSPYPKGEEAKDDSAAADVKHPASVDPLLPMARKSADRALTPGEQARSSPPIPKGKGRGEERLEAAKSTAAAGAAPAAQPGYRRPLA